jgi:hypothetical protein
VLVNSEVLARWSAKRCQIKLGAGAKAHGMVRGWCDATFPGSAQPFLLSASQGRGGCDRVGEECKLGAGSRTV